MREYILELLRNGMWVFPIQGKGKDVAEAKRPLSFKNGEEIITWKKPEILDIAYDLAERGHHAWAMWLQESFRFGIDIDLYKYNPDLARELEQRLRKYPEIYSEKSARGGIHIILRVDENKNYKVISEKPFVEWKYDGYFIIAPSALKTNDGEYRYNFIAGNLLNTISVEEWNTVYAWKFEDILGKTKIVTVTNSMRMVTTGGNNLKINGLNLPIDELTDEQITALLYLLWDQVDCPGMVKLMEWIGEHNLIPIRKRMYNLMRIPRTTRWLTYYTLATALAWLGASADRVYTYLNSIKLIDEDEDPPKDSLNNAIYNIYQRRNLLLLPRGACPFCQLMIGRESCSDTPIHKLMCLPPERVKQILEFIKRHIN